MADKNQAVIDFLLTCPQLSQNPVFFNYINAKDDNKQIITLSNDISLNETYIDGGVLKRYSFTLIDFKSITDMAIPKAEGYTSENVEDMLDVQTIIDWVTEQADARNYPDFGDDYIIDSMRVLTDNPNLNGIDTTATPALAKYSFTVQIDYLDNSKRVW